MGTFADPVSQGRPLDQLQHQRTRVVALCDAVNLRDALGRLLANHAVCIDVVCRAHPEPDNAQLDHSVQSRMAGPGYHL